MLALDPLFTLDEVRVAFGDRLALDTGNRTLEAATTVAVMGPNGSGKTTLLRVLAGLIEPAAGTVRTSGSRPTMAYVAQHQHQHAWMPLTVAEVLRMGRYRQRGLLGRLTRDDRRLVAEAADRLRVTDLLGRAFGELSGGQRQRVLMAGALANDADCLLLDEPITGLDLPSQRLILDIVDAERDRGRLVLLTTHHLDEARHCDRVLLLNTTVVADGTPDEVLVQDNLTAAFGPRVVNQESHHGHHDHHGSGPHLHDHGHDHDDHDHDQAEVLVIDEHGHGGQEGDLPIGRTSAL
jgi:ABC-type Mn2+/Zn2+ transport system ATPase subunit